MPSERRNEAEDERTISTEDSHAVSQMTTPKSAPRTPGRVRKIWFVAIASIFCAVGLGYGSVRAATNGESRPKMLCAGIDGGCQPSDARPPIVAMALDSTSGSAFPSTPDSTIESSLKTEGSATEVTATTVDPDLRVSPDLGPPASCGDVDADLVSRALDTKATFLGVDPSGCGFTAGQWTLGVRVDPYDPAATGDLKTSPSIDGAKVPNQTIVTNDRSGGWWARSTLIVKDRLYTFQLVDSASGSDTYPATNGEPQRQVTESATTRLIDEIAATVR